MIQASDFPRASDSVIINPRSPWKPVGFVTVLPANSSGRSMPHARSSAR